MEISNGLTEFGWILLHSIWQGAIVAIVLYLLLFVGRNVFTSNNRYVLSIIGLLVVCFWSLHTFWHFGFLPANAQPGDSQIFTFTNLASAGVYTSWTDKVEVIIEENMNYILTVWMFGMLVCLFRISSGLWGIGQLRKSFIVVDGFDSIVRSLKSRFGLKKIVQVGESRKIKIPVVLGHLRPMILFPIGYMSGMDLEQLQMIIAHELAHIKRNDYLVNLIQQVVESIYFFNPFIWWISNQIKAEREFACDDLVLRSSERSAYAKALLAGYDHAQVPALTLGFWGNRQNIVSRINRIMDYNKNNHKKRNILSLPVLIFLMAGLIWSQKNNITETDVSGNIKYASLMNNGIEIDPVGFNIDLTDFYYMDTLPDIQRKDNKLSEEDRRLFDNLDSFDTDEMDNMLDMLRGFEMPEMPEMPEIEIPPMPRFNFDFKWDTIIPNVMIHEFEKSMREFEERQKEMMMNFETNSRRFEMNQEMAEKIQKEVLRNIENLDFDHFDNEYIKQFEDVNQELAETINAQMKELEERLKRMNLEGFEDSFKKMEETIREETKHLREFESAIKKELIKDGYWNEGEQLDLQFNDENIEVNDKKVKDKDFEKYMMLKEQYFPEDKGSFRYRVN